MTDLHRLRRARFASVRRDLDQVLDRFTDDDFGWKPADGMLTVGGQILEIVDKDRESVVWLKAGSWPDDQPPTFELETTSLHQARDALDAVRRKTLSHIDSMTEAEPDFPALSPERLPQGPSGDGMSDKRGRE